MKILGIKYTHDASLCLIDNGRVIFNFELEKIGNAPRYTKLTDLLVIEHMLDEFGYHPDDITFVVDGWKGSKAQTPFGELDVAPYHEFDKGATLSTLFGRYQFRSGRISESITAEYTSYPHVAGHVLGAYMSSPFAEKKEVAYIISWDGGQNPRIHKVDPNSDFPVQFVGPLHDLYGIIYAVMGNHYGPYKKQSVIEDTDSRDWAKGLSYDVPGKLMSYIALGRPSHDLIYFLHKQYDAIEVELEKTLSELERFAYNQASMIEDKLIRTIAQSGEFVHLSDADVLASIHMFLEELLVQRACFLIAKGSNLCFTGGSALNIKWNSALRESGHFKSVWVPPFPNDAGSAFGMAAAEWAFVSDFAPLQWDVYSGLAIEDADQFFFEPNPLWDVEIVDPYAIAKLLNDYPDQAVISLNGRAEAGPRALGNRSILMSPVLTSNKALLNAHKKREEFRPVAPICLEDDAPQYFDPGTPDPYMLFDHHVRGDGDLGDACSAPIDEIAPAIVHLDGTARLQTVNRDQNALIYDLLVHYKQLSGVPLLCNTSANFNGSGFFPDVASAMKWAQENGVRYIWSQGYLFTKKEA